MLNQSFIVEPENTNTRIDVYVSKKLMVSRAKAQKLIESGAIFHNNKITSNCAAKIKENDTVDYYKIEKIKLAITENLYQNIKILFEHEHFLIIDKPAALCTHPAHEDDIQPTIANWINHNQLFEKNIISENNRQGIVHRLDKDTSGIMIIAKTAYAENIFIELFNTRKIKKEYIAIVEGSPSNKNGIVDVHIMRDPICPVKMCYSLSQGRASKTEYETILFNDQFSVIKCKPITGRTHQIRIHMAYLGCPIIGDLLYGKKSNLITRQALHAAKIQFEFENTLYEFKSEVAIDMQHLIKLLF